MDNVLECVHLSIGIFRFFIRTKTIHIYITFAKNNDLQFIRCNHITEEKKLTLYTGKLINVS